jgi:hypothetical protein
VGGLLRRAAAEASGINDRPGPDLLTAIAAVFVGGVGVSLVIGSTVPTLVGRGVVDNMTDIAFAFFADYALVALVSSVVGAAVVRAVFGFAGQPISYARALGALLLGSAAEVLVLAVLWQTSSLATATGLFNPLGWVGSVLSVFILMKAPGPPTRAAPQWEYKIPPGGAAWASDLEQQEAVRRRA